ncbi:MAG: V-type ATP synthase subunit E, partial [Thermoplasmata archaeon]
GAIKNAAELLGRELEVLCNPQDAAIAQRVSSEITPGSTVNSTNINYLGGAMIRAKDGSSQIDATFEGLLDRMRNTLRKEVAEMLFTAEAKAGPKASGEV